MHAGKDLVELKGTSPLWRPRYNPSDLSSVCARVVHVLKLGFPIRQIAVGAPFDMKSQVLLQILVGPLAASQETCSITIRALACFHSSYSLMDDACNILCKSLIARSFFF